MAYASRSMSDTEKRYAQIEKEALATTWACEKFSDFILGKRIDIETDHKPLVPLLGMKHLDSLPPRVLRFRLRLDRYNYDICHVPGKSLYTADTLSRAPLPEPLPISSIQLQELAEQNVLSAVYNLPVSSHRLKIYRQAQSVDPVCKILLQYCRDGWPPERKIDPTTRPYWEVQAELTTADGLIMRGNRLVIPDALQTETLKKLHEGHLGITRCRLRAKTAVWWPGLSKKIAEFVNKCPECARNSTPRKQPLIPTVLPDHPWQRVAADLFHLKGAEYIVIIDYFSRYPEVIKLRSTTSLSVIHALKSVFSRHGIPEILISDNGPQFSSRDPEILISDNGPQFSSREFAGFTKYYQFTHTTSSPHYPASNGQAERAVQTVKDLLKDADDPFLALLSYRATPLPWCGRSPSELLMGRSIRINLPQTSDSLIPQWSYLPEFRRQNNLFKQRQKRDYDCRHRTQELPAIPDGTEMSGSPQINKPQQEELSQLLTLQGHTT